MHSQAYAQKGVSGQKLIGVEMMPGRLGKMARPADGESHGLRKQPAMAGGLLKGIPGGQEMMQKNCRRLQS